MTLRKSIEQVEKALGPGNEARFAENRKVAALDAAPPSPAYEAFPAGDRDAPQLFPGGKPSHFGQPITPVPNVNRQANGVNEIVNGTNTGRG